MMLTMVPDIDPCTMGRARETGYKIYVISVVIHGIMGRMYRNVDKSSSHKIGYREQRKVQDRQA